MAVGDVEKVVFKFDIRNAVIGFEIDVAVGAPYADIARALAALAENVRTNSFAIEDLRGSTFTISNLGAIGGSYSTPIINPPEVAILLVGRSRKMPVSAS